MQEPQAPTPFALKDSFGPGGNFLLALARLMAIIGGLIFVGLVLMSLVSIVGRKNMGFVVPGDVEARKISQERKAGLGACLFFGHAVACATGTKGPFPIGMTVSR